MDERKPWPAYSVKRIREGNSLDSNSYNTGCKMFFLLTGHAYANEPRVGKKNSISPPLPFRKFRGEKSFIPLEYNRQESNRIERSKIATKETNGGGGCTGVQGGGIYTDGNSGSGVVIGSVRSATSSGGRWVSLSRRSI